MIGIHGETWERWILENVERGCSPRQMLPLMLKSSVWTAEQAAEALKEAFKDEALHLADLPTIPNKQDIEIDGVKIHVSTRMTSPHVCVLDGLLTEDECDQMLEETASEDFDVSGVVDAESGESIRHTARTSTSTFFHRADTPLIDKIEKRIAALTSWPVTHAEGLQMLRYEIGQQYKSHFDWFNDDKSGAAKHLERGGQRVSTTIIYLATPEKGGATFFPKVGLSVSPKRGSAVFFRNLTPDMRPDELTLHAGAPVEQGTKIIMTYWQRQNQFA